MGLWGFMAPKKAAKWAPKIPLFRSYPNPPPPPRPVPASPPPPARLWHPLNVLWKGTLGYILQNGWYIFRIEDNCVLCGLHRQQQHLQLNIRRMR